jgi:tRNA pseudouridine55 synthase
VKRRGGRLHGLLVIDKPAGMTSHDVVARVRRLTGESRVGHAGTLDPAATGVLPVCVGQATRLVEYLSDADKCYLTEVVLGVQTDTDDLEGAIVRAAPVPPLTDADLERLLGGFRGPIEQTPPAYAAIKVGGQRLYDLARAGREVAIPVRAVTIHRLALLAWRPPALTLLVECSKGTYIRSLARDIGAAAGCGGYVQALRRVRAGPFCLADSLTLDALAALDLPAAWPEIALPLDAFLRDWPSVHLDEAAARAFRHGNPVAAPTPAAAPDASPTATPTPAGSPDTSPDILADGALGRVYGPAGRLLGTARYDAATQRWRPDKVLAMGDDS